MVSSRFSFFKAFLVLFDLLWVGVETGLESGAARWGGETSKRRGVGWRLIAVLEGNRYRN
jgi:hypothetical protein